MAVGALSVVAAAVTPVALAGADGAAVPSSTGGWLSSVPVDAYNHTDSSQVTALNGHGQGVVAWRDNVTGSITVSQIAPGHSWSAPQPLAHGTQPLAHGTQPAVAIDATGDITVTWVDAAGNVDYGYRAAGAAGFVTGVVAANPGDASNPRVVMDSGGNAWVVWSAPGPLDPAPFDPEPFTPAVYGARIPADALAAGGAPSWQARLGATSYPDASASLTTNPSGSAVIAAFTTPDNQSIAVTSAPSGAGSLSTPSRAVPDPGPGGMFEPVVALSDSGSAALAWEQCGSRFDPDCDSSTIEVAGATATQLAAAGFSSPQALPLGVAGGQYHPHIAVNDDELALAWDDITLPPHAAPSYAVDGATEPLAALTGGSGQWQQLPSSILGGGAAVPGVGPRIAIDASSDVTLVWDSTGRGQGLSTVNAARAQACAPTCASSSVTQLDTQANAPARLALAGAAAGDALLSWASYAPNHGVGASPTVADVYDPGPVLSNLQIPTTVTAGTAQTFAVDSSDNWTALEGPIVTTWNFGDGTTATGNVVSHTYASAGTYTVTVTAATTSASTTISTANTTATTTISSQVVVSAAAAPAVQPADTPPALAGVAAWGTRNPAHTVAAQLTVPALSCAGNTLAATGQELGVRLWGSGVKPLADFAGIDVECRHHTARYRPTFTVADVSARTSIRRNAKLNVSPGDLLQAVISDRDGHTLLTLTDLSTQGQAPVTSRGPSLAPEAGWQVGAFPIVGLPGPYPTVPIGFANVSADGTGLGSLGSLAHWTWGSASVSQVGKANNGMSVVFSTVPPAPMGGSVAAPARGAIRYRPPGSHSWRRLRHNTPLAPNTLIDATQGTVQVSNPEPHGQSQSVTAWGGQFSTSADRHGHATINVSGTWEGSSGASGAQASAAAGRHRHKPKKAATGNLWAKGHGNFTTKGNDGAAAVLGTKWLTRNLKHGTLFKVAANRYDKHDAIRVTVYYPHRHTVILRQGHSIVAPAPKPKVKPKLKPKPKPKPKKKPQVNPFAFTLVGVNKVDGRYNTPAPGYYQLVLLSKTRPYYVDAAVAPLPPSGGGAWFYPDGSAHGVPRWEVHFQLDQNLATFKLWNIGIKLGSKLYVVPLRLK